MQFAYEQVLSGDPPGYGQDITASAASTHKIKIGTNAGAGEPIRVALVVTDTFTDAGNDATLTPSIQACGTESGSYADIVVGPAIPVASLVEGMTPYIFTLPASHAAYIRGYFTVANGPFTAGSVILGIVKDTDSNHSH